MLKWLIGVLIIMMVVAGTIALTSESDSHPLASFDMQDKNVVETVQFLEANTFDRLTFAASIDGETLRVQDEESTKEYSLPDDMFYASIAPYVDSTHACGIHNLVTCQGEMNEEAFDVVVRNDSGDIVFDDTVVAKSNGFFGVWLPRDIEGTIDIEHENMNVQGAISTFADSNTCYTDFQLQ